MLKNISIKRVYKNGLSNASVLMDTDIGSIHYRAQDVKPGGLFVAIKGQSADGYDFIDLAVKKGASAVVAPKPVLADTTVIEVENTRKFLAQISACFYNNPSKKMVAIGITGTNGKTTTAYLIESILNKAGYITGVIGTINYRYCGRTYNSSMTTPESADLQKILAEMLKQGVTHVVMEVSSHALDMHRMESCWLDVGVFTNLTQDHLDYHKDMDSYWTCKKKMFFDNLTSLVKKNATAVINCDSLKGKELYKDITEHKISVGMSNGNSVICKIDRQDLTGIEGALLSPGGEINFRSSLVGRHNAQNLACAAGVGIALKIEPDIIKAGIESVDCVPGRLERIYNDHQRFVYVDYAHTPDAIENVLSTLKSMAIGRLICVFGCGGDRDIDKRPLMGKIAGTLCDLVVVTSDNPRTEPPGDIIDQIICGMQDSAAEYVAQPDRRCAIELAIKLSEPNDTVLIAGKGHETYQILGGKKILFDDRKEAKKAISRVLN